MKHASAVNADTNGAVQLPNSSVVANANVVAGAAIDGYVQGATVDLQAYVQNAQTGAWSWVTETTTLTDASGAYNFTLNDATISKAIADAQALNPNYVRVIIEGGGYDQNTGQQVGSIVAGASMQSVAPGASEIGRAHV